MPAILDSEKLALSSDAAGLPKYQVLADLLRSRISEGQLKPGDRMPSFSEIGAEHRVTLTTVKRVYDLLEKEGLVERQQGRGTFVCEKKRVLTGNIGILGTQDIRLRKTQYYDSILTGIENYASENGQHILFIGDRTDYDQDFSRKVDGFLLCDVEFQTAHLQQLMASQPCVSMFSKSDNTANVMADDFEGAKRAIRHLVDMGHRRIACMMEKQLFVSVQRYAGYREGLSDAGIQADPAWARLTGIAFDNSPDFSYLEWGRSQMEQWLQEGWRDLGCSAILAQNDAMAIGIMQTLQDNYIQVPHEVSILGFDGTDLCDHASPRISSMKVPLVEIGYTAAQVLHEQILQPETASRTRTIMLPITLRPGKSVANIVES